MPNVNATKYTIGNGQMFNNDFESARETGQNHTDNSTASNTRVIQYFQDSGKSGINYQFTRLFCAFDLSSYTSGTITNLTFNYRSTTTTSNAGALERRIAIVKFDGMGNGPSFSNYDDSEFFDDIDYSSAYTDVLSTIPQFADANQDNAVAMNSAAISDGQSDGQLKFAVVQYTNDYNNNGSISDVDAFYFANFSTSNSGFVPFLSFDYAAGYGHDVLGVSSGNIANVKGVATANIANVIGVS